MIDPVFEIAAVLDAQGFYFNSKFYPVELIYYNGNELKQFKTNIPLAPLSIRDLITVKYVTKHVHGLAFKMKSDVKDDT